MINIIGLSKSFGKHEVLKSISLTLPNTGLVIIKGENGSGKSSLLNILAGLDRKYDGIVEVDGKDLSSFTDAEISDYQRDYISYVFQKDNLLNFLNRDENLSLSYLLKKKALVSRKKSKTSITSLSQGQQKMLAIERCFDKDSKLILLDEVTSSLDDKNTDAFFQKVKELSKSKLIILVSHDIRLCKQADIIYVLDKGKVNCENKDGTANCDWNRHYYTKYSADSRKQKLSVKLFLKSQKKTCLATCLSLLLSFVLCFLTYLGSMCSYMDPYPFLKAFINEKISSPDEYCFTSIRSQQDADFLNEHPNDAYKAVNFQQTITIGSGKEAIIEYELIYDPTVDNDGLLHLNSFTASSFDIVDNPISVTISTILYKLDYVIDESVQDYCFLLNPNFTSIVNGEDITCKASLDLTNGFWNTDEHTGAYYIENGNYVLGTSSVKYMTKEYFENNYDQDLDFEISDDEIYTNYRELVTEGKTTYPDLYYSYDDYYICNMRELFPDGFNTNYFSADVRSVIAILSDNSMRKLLSIFPQYDCIAIKPKGNNNLIKDLAHCGYRVGTLKNEGDTDLDTSGFDNNYSMYLMALNVTYNPQSKAAYLNLAIYCPICVCLLELCFCFLLISMQIKNLRILKSFGLDRKRIFLIAFIPTILVCLLANVLGYLLVGAYLVVAEPDFVTIPPVSSLSWSIGLVTLLVAVIGLYLAYRMVKKHEKISF